MLFHETYKRCIRYLINVYDGIIRMYKKRIMMFVVLTAFIFCQITTVSAAEISDNELHAKAACLMDGDSGRVLYQKQADEPMPMASTTKIMTGIIALESGDTSSVVTASKEAAKAPQVHLGVQEGQTFLLGDLLYGLLLESFNDTAVMIAESVGESVEGFTNMMNAKAKEIGCRDTHFVSPNGLDASDEGGIHHTTAQDLALIMRYCISISPKKDEFIKITQTPSYSFWDHDNQVFYNCNNHNAFLNMMDGALSGKTGFTAKAGYCYIGALERDGKLLIVSLLACGWPNNKTYKWADTKKLMTYGLENYEYRDIYKDGILAEPITVTDGQYEGRLGGGESHVMPVYKDGREVEERRQMLLSPDENVEVKVNLPRKLKAPVKAKTKVGDVSYHLNGNKIIEYPVYLEKTVRRIDLAWCMGHVFSIFLDQE